MNLIWIKLEFKGQDLGYWMPFVWLIS